MIGTSLHRSARDPVGQHSVNRISASCSGTPGKASEDDLFVQLYDQDFKDVADETESLSVIQMWWTEPSGQNMQKHRTNVRMTCQLGH